MNCSLWFLLVLFSCSSCASQDSDKPVKTQLEIRQFQTKNFEAADVPMVMKSLLNVLQDEGFTVKNVALDLGFISAVREEDVENGSRRFWSQVSHGGEARWVKNERIEATINVSQFGALVRVRTNFQRKVFDNMGAVVTIQPIVDEAYYVEFFSKVSKSIFIQEHEL